MSENIEVCVDVAGDSTRTDTVRVDTVVIESNKQPSYRYDPSNDEARRWTKLFVGGLPFTSDDYALHHYFAKYGAILEAVVIKDRLTDKSKGYGFVTMRDKEGAEKAVRNTRPVIEGRRCNVNYAFVGAKKKNVDSNWQDRCVMFDDDYYQFINPSTQTWTYTNVNCRSGFPMYQDVNDYFQYGFAPVYSPSNNDAYQTDPNAVAHNQPIMNVPMQYNIAHVLQPQLPYYCAYMPGATFGNFYYTNNPCTYNQPRSTKKITEYTEKPTANLPENIAAISIIEEEEETKSSEAINEPKIIESLQN